MPVNKNKESLIEYFNQMKGLEEAARDSYLQISSDSRVDKEEIRETFKKIADDENHHSEIVQKILNIIKNNL
jgi:rubrerythrin